VIHDCAQVGRRLLQWVWSERSQKATAFLDNVGGVWRVRLVCRTFVQDPKASRDLIEPILNQLSNPEFPIEYFSRLTDEVPHIWGADIADQLFRRIETLAAADEIASIESLLDVFAEEVRAASFWKRLLETTIGRRE
jgi:hypothetical protein